MKNNFFHGLYMTIREVRVRDCSATSLSHLLHGYLSVYAMVRISPGLESEYGTLQEIHGRLREIAGELSKVAKDTSVEQDERIGYIADLMDAYQTYSDMDLLDEALDMAYRVLSPAGSDRIVLPGKTLNVCRLLCDCYYFTGEERCLTLAEEVINDNVRRENLLNWLRAIENFGKLAESGGVKMWEEACKQEKEQLEYEVIHSITSGESEGVDCAIYYFEVLAMREYGLVASQEQKDLLEVFTLMNKGLDS